MWNRAVISLVVLSFFLGMCEFIMIGIVPDVAADLSVSITQIGMIISYFAIANAIGTPVLSLWASRFSRYHFMIVVTALFALGCCSTFLISNYMMLFWNRLFLAAVAGVLFSVSIAAAPMIAPRKYLAGIIAWLNAGFSIAAVFGLPIGNYLANYISWRLIFLGLGILTLLDLGVMMISLPKDKKSSHPASISHELSLLKDRRILKGALTVIFNASSSYCWYSYVTPLLTDGMKLPPEYVSIMLLLLGIGTIVSTLLGGRIAERGGVYIIWPIIVFHALLTFALLVTLHTWIGLVVLLGMGFLFYIQCASIQVFFLRISMLFHQGTMMMASAVSPMSFNLGVALGAALGSLTVDTLGLAWTPLPGGICMSLSAFFLWYVMLPERRRKKALQNEK